MKKCILFFDIDGTILSEKTNEISEDTKNAMQKAREHGHLLFINTGRTKAELDTRILSVPVDGFVCGCGTYIEYQKELLLQAELLKDLQTEIRSDINLCHLDVCYEGLEHVYLDRTSKNPIIKNLLINMTAHNLPLRDSSDNDINFTKFTIWTNKESNYEYFYNKYHSLFTFIDRGNQFYEVVPANYSKATGIDFLLKHFSIPLQNAYAFGDSMNDLPMLLFVPNSVAMGNASDEIKKQVSYITKDVDDFGISHALKHFGLLL